MQAKKQIEMRVNTEQATTKQAIIDVSGVELTPGHDGEMCLGNGKHHDEQGNIIECCCDDCDYLMECFGTYITEDKNERFRQKH